MGRGKVPEAARRFELVLDELPRGDDGRVDWARVYGRERSLRIEIGVGNSPFLIEVAKSAPEFDYLGFEYEKDRVRKFLKKVGKANVETIRMLHCDVLDVLEDIVPPGSVNRFYINHPDPWPKRRHAKNRLVRTENAQLLAGLLEQGGGLSLRTDAPAYAEQMLDVLDSCEGLVNVAGEGCFADEPRDYFPTPYESKFREQGLPIYYLEYEKR